MRPTAQHAHGKRQIFFYKTHQSYQFCEKILDWQSAAYTRDGEPEGPVTGAFEQSSGRKYCRYWSNRYGYTKSLLLLQAFSCTQCKCICTCHIHTSIQQKAEWCITKQFHMQHITWTYALLLIGQLSPPIYSATVHFPWQLHAPGTASRQLLGTRRHFFPSGAAWRHGCLNWHWRDTDFILRQHIISFVILVTL